MLIRLFFIEVPGFYYDASKNRYFPKKDERNATKHKTITLPAVLTAAPTPSISQLLDARQLGSIRPDSQSLLSFELEHLIARRITLPPLGANVVSIFQFQKVSVLVIYELAAVEIFLTDVESNRLDVVKHNFDNPIKRFSKKIVASFKRSPSCLRLILEDLSRDVISCSFEDWVVTVTKSLSLEASSFLQFAHQNASQGIPARSCFLEGRNGVFYNHQGDSFNLLAMSKKKLPFTNVTFVVRSPKSESMLLGCRDGSVYRHDKDQGFKLVGSVDGPVAFIEELSCCLIVATCKDTVIASGPYFLLQLAHSMIFFLLGLCLWQQQWTS